MTFVAIGALRVNMIYSGNKKHSNALANATQIVIG